MQARLIQLEGGRRVAETRILGRELRIGRDPTSDLVIDHASVSRHHAVVRELGERHAVLDLGSTNGVAVNGETIGGRPWVLSRGDVIELGARLELVYDPGPAPREWLWVAAAAAMLALLLVSVGLYAWKQGVRPLSQPRAEELAREAVSLFAAGKLEAASASLREAAGLLARVGGLEEVGRGDVLMATADLLGAQIGEAGALRELAAAARRAPPPAHARPDCRLDRLSGAALDACMERWIEHSLLGMGASPRRLPAGLVDEVALALLREHESLAAGLIRSDETRTLFEEETRRRGLPPVIAHVALAESGLDPGTRGPGRPGGLWRLLPGTARGYGLEVDGRHDERGDPRASTRAALRYLAELRASFGGDALLAVAGYGLGETRLRSALAEVDDPYDGLAWWRLADSGRAPTESRGRVIRFLAAALAAEGGLPLRIDLEARPLAEPADDTRESSTAGERELRPGGGLPAGVRAGRSIAGRLEWAGSATESVRLPGGWYATGPRFPPGDSAARSRFGPQGEPA